MVVDLLVLLYLEIVIGENDRGLLMDLTTIVVVVVVEEEVVVVVVVVVVVAEDGKGKIVLPFAVDGDCRWSLHLN